MRIRNARARARWGTVACIVRSQDPGDDARYLLSAGHVIGVNGHARPGDAIEVADSGGENWTMVGEFVRSTPLRDARDSIQHVDAAIARLTIADAPDTTTEFGPIEGVSTGLFEGRRFRFVGGASGKRAEAELFTSAMEVPVVYQDVDSPALFTLRFANQILYGLANGPDRRPATDFGDSGALVLSVDNEAMGLHLACTPDDFSVRASVCTPICDVFAALRVRLPDLPDECAAPAASALPSPQDALGERARQTFGVSVRSLLAPHGHTGPLRWQLDRDGVIVDGRLMRTLGAPETVAAIWRERREALCATARETKVPIELLIATVAAESRNKADALRFEPGWISDDATPSRISVGLTQTLLSTARAVLDDAALGRDALKDPAVSVHAGARVIAQDAPSTRFDPPLVACAYNAGRLTASSENRWQLRQTGNHADRFVEFFNDCLSHFRAENPDLGADVPSFHALLNPRGRK